MIRAIFLLFSSLAMAAPAAATPSAITLRADSDARWVPFELTPGNQIRVDALIDGRQASAIVDTGVSVSVVSRDFARAAGLKVGSAATADAIGGTIAIGWAKLDRLSLGGLSRKGGRIGIAPLVATATGGGARADALIGADILSCCALDIDYDAKRLRLLPSGRMPFRGDSAPLSIASKSGVYLSEMTLGNEHVRPVLVDTGDGAAVTVTKDVWHASDFGSLPTTSTVAFGLGGPIGVGMAIVPEVKIASLAARNIEVRIEDRRGFSSQTGTAGRIGSALLQRYRVLLDPHAGHIVFRSASGADTQPARSTSGLLVGLDRDRLRVLHVMAHSPAAKTGWHEGDTICRVDGVPVAAGGADDVDASWAGGAPGRTVSLGMCDGSERTLTLSRFY